MARFQGKTVGPHRFTPQPTMAEERFIILGKAHTGKLLVVVHTERSESLRIISARIASRRERKHYEESIQ